MWGFSSHSVRLRCGLYLVFSLVSGVRPDVLTDNSSRIPDSSSPNKVAVNSFTTSTLAFSVGFHETRSCNCKLLCAPVDLLSRGADEKSTIVVSAQPALCQYASGQVSTAHIPMPTYRR